MAMIRYIHVLLGVTLAGFFVGNYFYINLAIQQNCRMTLRFILSKSLLVDCILFLPIIVIVLATGSYQVIFLNLSLTTPWILSAYLFFLVFIILWLSLFCLKSYNYIFVKDYKILFKGEILFHCINLISIILFIVIIHDAIRKVTFVPWAHFMHRYALS